MLVFVIEGPDAKGGSKLALRGEQSEEHNDVSQTSTLSSNQNIQPNVLPGNDWQSSPLMALVNSI
jgi:hypothetical protein